jgi:predicted RNA-binding Zn-ribbon protein involved in translation (DUF1610 family)
MKETVKIEIQGVTASGKSRIAHIIKELLEFMEFEVELKLNEDHPTIENFNKVMDDHIDDVMEHLTKKTKVVIEEVQLTRERNFRRMTDPAKCEHPLRYKVTNDTRFYCPDCGKYLYDSKYLRTQS